MRDTGVSRTARGKMEGTISLVIFLIVIVAGPRVTSGVSNQTLRTWIRAIPFFLYIGVIARQLLRSDEFVRKTNLEHIAIAAAVTVCWSLVCTLLEEQGHSKVSVKWIVTVMGGTWGVLSMIDRLRNR